MSDNQSIITKYRPGSFDEMIGHEAVLGPLQRAIAGTTTPHAYLMTGVAGLGKTTLARIIARVLEAEILEIDAASNSGVDAAREIVEMGNHMSLMGSGRRAFIIDEAHVLSKSAWQALLKLLEEPPPHLYIMLCTTELPKVPDTIQTRCYHVALRPLKPDELGELLDVVADMEGWQVAPDVMQAVIEAATGQPRKGLTMLQSVHDAPDRNEVKRIIALLAGGDALYDVCNALVSNKGWPVVRQALLRIEDAEFETAAVFAGRYFASAMAKAETPAAAQAHWKLMDALLFPAETFDRKASFYAAVGRILWGG